MKLVKKTRSCIIFILHSDWGRDDVVKEVMEPSYKRGRQNHGYRMQRWNKY